MRPPTGNMKQDQQERMSLQSPPLSRTVTSLNNLRREAYQPFSQKAKKLPFHLPKKKRGGLRCKPQNALYPTVKGTGTQTVRRSSLSWAHLLPGWFWQTNKRVLECVLGHNVKFTKECILWSSLKYEKGRGDRFWNGQKYIEQSSWSLAMLYAAATKSDFVDTSFSRLLMLPASAVLHLMRN